MAYSLELNDDEVELVVEALRIQLERWQDTLRKKSANDPTVSHISRDDIRQGLRRHENLLERLPKYHGLAL